MTLELKLESAAYSELDFPVYNGPGFTAVQQAVAVAQQTRALAQTPEEMQRAAWLMRSASDRKNYEQEIAMRNFEQARQAAHDALRQVMNAVQLSTLLWGPRKLEIENRLDHLLTKFSLKNFAVIEREAKQLLAKLSVPKPAPRPVMPPRTPMLHHSLRPPKYQEPQSASAWFERGRMLEDRSKMPQAVDAYRQALRMNPRHFQAENQLSRLTRQPGRKVS